MNQQKNNFHVYVIPPDLSAKTFMALWHTQVFQLAPSTIPPNAPSNLSALPTPERSGDCLFTVYRGKPHYFLLINN